MYARLAFKLECSNVSRTITYTTTDPDAVTYTVGRRPDNTVVLPSSTELLGVGGQHFQITVSRQLNTITIEDRSTNGTFLNGVKIGKGMTRELRHGDIIDIVNPVRKTPAVLEKPGVEDPATCQWIFCCELCRIGKYIIDKEHHYLAEGGFGKVYAVSPRIAVKEVKKERVLFAAFEKETKVARKMQHPNLLSIIEIGDDDECYYIFMERMNSGDLLDYVIKLNAEGKMLSEAELKHIVYQVAKGLMYMHGNSAAHRDIKPENILLSLPDHDKNNNKENSSSNHSLLSATVKLADFGLSKVCSDGDTLRTNLGTIGYRAPEVKCGQYDFRADVYSLGATIFAVTTMSNPSDSLKHRKDDSSGTIKAIIPRAFSENGYSSTLGELLVRMLSLDPQRRPTILEVMESEWLQEEREKDECSKRNEQAPKRPREEVVSQDVGSTM